MEAFKALGLGGIRGPQGFGLETATLGLLLAFVLGQIAAWVYMYTHTGLSYSRAFVQSIVLLCLIISLGMMVIGNNIVIAFGLIGALSVIRFRNILKDTRDTAFIFFALVIGMATGTGSYPLALLGTGVFCIVLLYLHWADFGTRRTGDAFVRLQWAVGATQRGTLDELLRRHCRTATLVSQRIHESGAGDLAFRLILRDPSRADDLVAELNRIEGVSNVSFALQEEQAEI